LTDAWYPGSDWKQTWLSNISGLGVQGDDDWYKIDVDAGREWVVVDCQFSVADGDIDIALYDSDGTELTYSESITDNEKINYIVPSGGASYYILVYFEDAGNTYDLWWDDQIPLSSENDECADSITAEEGVPFVGSTVSATGTNSSSCVSDGEDALDYLDVWHNYTPVVSGEVTIRTDGSDFDTTLAVFDACGGTELACNDDSGSSFTSQIVINMTAGQTYQVRVAGYDGETGNYVLTASVSSADSDGDLINDDVDNCPNTFNSDQLDADSDGIGDVCDNCPDTANSDQEDDDNDGIGNVCENVTSFLPSLFLLLLSD
jgi:hypothetical protein